MKTTPLASHRSLLVGAIFLALFAGCGTENPAGIKNADLRGTWSGALDGTQLLGRTLTGEIDWVFDRETFIIVFFSGPAGQAERIEGDWKFSNQRLVLTLKSSFPIDTDIGAKDTLFVSLLNNELSLKSIASSEILLRKTRSAGKPAQGAAWLASAGVLDPIAPRDPARSPDEHARHVRRTLPAPSHAILPRYSTADHERFFHTLLPPLQLRHGYPT